MKDFEIYKKGLNNNYPEIDNYEDKLNKKIDISLKYIILTYKWYKFNKSR